MANLATSVAGVEFPGFVMNAAVPAALSLDDAKEIGASDSAAILIKSVTKEPREGNPEPRYASLPYGSLNSIGLMNEGYEAILPYAAELQEYDKPIFISISGFSADEYQEMTAAFSEVPVDFIELNLSCPNVPNKPIVGYDAEQVKTVLEAVKNLRAKKIGFKLPPYLDGNQLKQIADLMLDAEVDFVTCTNTLGNSLFIDAETEATVMKAGNGFGGLAGSYIKPVALGNVRKFYELFDGKIAVIGAGGISSGEDAFEFLLAGAEVVQVGTAFYEEGPELFAKINQELAELLDQKGYDDVASVRGKLKFI